MPKDLTSHYYNNYLIYNLEKLELITSDDNFKEGTNKKNIQNAIEYMYENRKRIFANKQSMKLFVKELVTIFYKSSIRELDNFSKDYLNDDKKEAFSSFIDSLYNKINFSEEDDKLKIISIAAWIEYNFIEKNFLKNDNLIISQLLATYILMVKNLQLPQVLNKKNIQENSPKTFNKESLKSWENFYYSQFGAWEIGKKETFNQSLSSNETMLRQITRTVEDIREMQIITGETSLEKLIVHNIDRAILQALIIKFVSEYQIKDEDQLIALVEEYYQGYLAGKNSHREEFSISKGESHTFTTNRDNLLSSVKKKESYYGQLFDTIEKNKFFLGNENFRKEEVISCQEIMKIKEKLINDNAASLSSNSTLKADFEKKYKVYKQLVVDEMLRHFIEYQARSFVEGFISNSLSKLEKRANLGRVTWIVAGGPASGKTSIVELAEKDLGEDKVNTAILNPDYYKKILLNPKEVEDPVKHAELTHVESSYINKRIMSKMKTLINKGQAPDILFDAVKASQDKVIVTKEGNATINIYMATCSPEEAVRRAFDRGRRHGRFVPTEIVLEGHQEATELLPEVLSKNNVAFRLFYTEVPLNKPPIEIASIYDRSTILDIHNAKLMLNFILKSKINTKAKSPDEIYIEEVYQDKIRQIALCLIDYIKQGLTLRFGYYSRNGKYKSSAIISPTGGLLITNISQFINDVSHGDITDKNEYAAKLIFNLSLCEVNNKKLSVSLHSGKTSRKDFYIENGQCLYCTQTKTEFSNLYKLISKDLKDNSKKIEKSSGNIKLDGSADGRINPVNTKLKANTLVIHAGNYSSSDSSFFKSEQNKEEGDVSSIDIKTNLLNGPRK